jgi:hypothetical protein
VPVSAEARQLQGEALVSPQVKNPELSGKTTKAILKGMELLPEKRPQSVLDWLKLLGVEQKASGAPSRDAVNWVKWGVIVAAVTTLITLVMGLPGWLALKKPDPQPLPQGTPAVQPSAKPTK